MIFAAQGQMKALKLLLAAVAAVVCYSSAERDPFESVSLSLS